MLPAPDRSRPTERDAEARTMELLEESLSSRTQVGPNEVIERRMLVAATAQDIEELHPQLEPRAERTRCRSRNGMLAPIVVSEKSEQLRDTLVRHRDQVKAELARHERDYTQLVLDFQGPDTMSTPG